MALPESTRISVLDLATPLVSADQIAVVQSGVTKRATIEQVSVATNTSCQCTLVNRFTQKGNVANTLKQYIWTYQLPPNTIPANGGWLEINSSGEFATNNNLKLVEITFDTTTFSITTGGADGNNKGWDFRVRVDRMTANTQNMTGKFSAYPRTSYGASNGTGFPKGSVNADLTQSVAISIAVQTDTSAADDILINDFKVRLNNVDADS